MTETQRRYFVDGPIPPRDPFTDPESLVITYRGARLALYQVEGEGGDYIAVEGFTPEIADELLHELNGLPVIAHDRLDDYFAGLASRDENPFTDDRDYDAEAVAAWKAKGGGWTA